MPRSGLEKLFTKRRIKKLLALIAALILVAMGYTEIPVEQPDLIGVASVIDGDTIEIHGKHVRFFGMDAPESQQTCKRDDKEYLCGKEASIALADQIGRQTVRCDKQDTDKYDRPVAICYVGEKELNRWMVANGHALAYRHYSDRYVSEERQAKKARLGIWAGAFQAPWDFRHAQWETERRNQTSKRQNSP